VIPARVAPDRPVVVSLSSIPPRFRKLGRVPGSLCRQKLRPSRIVLVIPRHYRRFPDWDGHLPEVPEGVEVLRVEDDLGPATKVLPVARTLRGTATDLAYCDDDVELPAHWLRALRRVSRDRPGMAVTATGFDLSSLAGHPRRPHDLPRAIWLTPQSPPDPGRQKRAHIETAGFADIAMGRGGVLVRPGWFPDAAFDIPRCAWPVDDIWLSGWLAAQDIPVWVDPIVPVPMLLPLAHNASPLLHAVIDGQDRSAANQATVAWWRAHGIWKLPARH
jgi:hypothetical protein